MTEVKTPPAHPGEVLGYELFRRGLNQRQAARLLGVSYALIGRIINGMHGVSTTLAYRLELAGVGAAVEWLAWQAEYDLWRVSFLNFSDVQPFPPPFVTAPEPVYAIGD